MKRSRRLAVLFAALSCAVGAASAQGVDRLSGDYRPAGEGASSDGTQQAGLRVVADGAGWLAWFGGEPKRLEPADPNQLAAMFPGVGESRQLQCGVSSEFVLCHVLPGTYFPQQGFQVDSGWFSVVGDSGLYQLERAEPAAEGGR